MRASPRKKRRAWALRKAAGVLAWTPTAAARPVLRAVARWFRGSRAGEVARQQVAEAGERLGWSPSEQARILAEVERHMVEQLLVVSRLSRGSRSWLDVAVTLSPQSEPLEALRGGAVIAAAHHGHWELLAVWLKRQGIEGAVVGRGGPSGDWLAEVRGRHGVTTIPQDAPARRSLEVLRAGGVLGIVCDLEARQLDGVHVPFLGRPALTMTAPAALARAARVPIVPARCLEIAPGRYEVHLGARIEPPARGARSDEMLDALTQLNDRISAWIVEAPGQWAWHQARWRTQEGEWDARPNPAFRLEKRVRQS